MIEPHDASTCPLLPGCLDARHRGHLLLAPRQKSFSFCLSGRPCPELYYCVLVVIVAITNFQNLSDLMYKFIILRFWKSELWSGSYWTKIKVSAALHSFWRLCGRILAFPLPASRGPHIPWLVVMHCSHLCSHFYIFSPPDPPTFFLSWSLWLYWTHSDGSGSLPHLNILNLVLASAAHIIKLEWYRD